MNFLQPTDKEVFLTSSVYISLITAYSILDIQRLVVPAYASSNLVAAAALQKIEVIYCDVDAFTGCLEVFNLEQIDDDSYDGVVVVCPFSSIPQLRELEDYCKTKDKKLIIEGSDVLGTEGIYNYGDAFCFSLGDDLGVLLADKKQISRVERFLDLGFKPAECLLDSLEYRVSWVEDRRPRWLEIIGKCKNKLGRYLLKSSIEETVYKSIPLFMTSVGYGNQVREFLLQEGIKVGQYYKPLADLPVSNDLYRRNIFIPIEDDISDEDLDKLINILYKF